MRRWNVVLRRTRRWDAETVVEASNEKEAVDRAWAAQQAGRLAEYSAYTTSLTVRPRTSCCLKITRRSVPQSRGADQDWRKNIMTSLRNYQACGVARIKAGLERGMRRICYVAPTASGKTVVVTAFVRDLVADGRRIVVFAHRQEIITQLCEALAAEGIVFGIIAAGHDENPMAPVQIAMAQTLVRRLDRLSDVEFFVIDECFPAGTLIDGIPIERLRVGDHVRSFNHETGIIEWRRVTHVFRSRPTAMVTVHLCDGRAITCTANHPFYTRCGYIAAAALSSSSEVFNGIQQEQDSHSSLHRLQDIGDVRGQSEVGASSQRSRLLLGQMPRQLGSASVIGDDESDQQEIRCAYRDFL
jgi:hypothetical protein